MMAGAAGSSDDLMSTEMSTFPFSTDESSGVGSGDDSVSTKMSTFPFSTEDGSGVEVVMI